MNPSATPLVQGALVVQADLDSALRTLSDNKRRWVRTDVATRVALLARIKECLMPVARSWVEGAAVAKGLPLDSPLVGEEWLSGPYGLMAWCNSMTTTLERVVGRGHLDGIALRTLPNGQLAAKVFPQSAWDRLLFGGLSAEVWMQPGVSAADLPGLTAATYNPPGQGDGKVALVLGAGNIAAIAPLDCLHKLFVDDAVAILKMNPVNDYLAGYLEQALAPLIDEGFLRIVRGDALVGHYLCTHPLVDALHITGSGASHDAIVWGAPDRAAINKRAGTPVNARPMSAELGGVGPTIVVPGPWTKADLRFQAEHVATQKLHNAGFNCIACQVLILPADWPSKVAFVDRITQALAASRPRPTYYPGTRARLQKFQTFARLPDTTQPSAANECLVARFDARHPQPVESFEVFGPALAITELPSADAEAFLVAAVAYANTRLDGTLGANILIHPTTLRQIGRPRFERILADLRYGCIAINAWTGLGFLLAPATWGAFPGHTPADVQSGIGVVHNTMLFEQPERTVVHAPFRPFPRGFLSGSFSLLPRPPWFVTNRRARALGELLTRFQYRPSFAKLPRILLNALLG